MLGLKRHAASEVGFLDKKPPPPFLIMWISKSSASCRKGPTQRSKINHK